MAGSAYTVILVSYHEMNTGTEPVGSTGESRALRRATIMRRPLQHTDQSTRAPVQVASRELPRIITKLAQGVRLLTSAAGALARPY
jgi:hypothetical protein